MVTATEFEASLVPRNMSALRLEVWLGTFLIPMFWLLDWLVIPEQVWVTLWMRVACCAIGVMILFATHLDRDFVIKHLNKLSFCYSLAVAWSIAVMCFLHEGYSSPYYAGINLTVMCVGFLFSWRSSMAISFNLAIYCFYMAPLVLGLARVSDLTTAVSNQFFLISTAVVTVASQIHRRSLERREFDAHVAQQHLLAEVQTMATIDWLTSLYNRRHFFRLGDEEIARARRYEHSISVIMIDIDHFKLINDTYGHTVGDEVLCAIAKRILSGLRQSDIAGRYGGEEFAIVLPETDMVSACNIVAERLRDMIASRPIESAEGPLSVTISVGVAGVDVKHDNLLDALTRADTGLYAAKRSGRNCVVLWSQNLAKS